MTPRVVTASAPARVDLGGGWTDVAPYTTEVGGAVCNVAIELRAVASVHTGQTQPAPPDEPLLRAAWERAGMPNVVLGLKSAVPVGSGLGGSSAAGVALAAALAVWRDQVLSAQELAELSRLTESETMGLAGGCQDHYAAAFGGALLLRCAAQTDVEQIAMSESAVTLFEQRTMIAFTGESRMSARTITAVLDAYRANDPKTCDALAQMATLAPLMAAALAQGDLDRLGQLLADQWKAQRALHPTISTPLIDRIVSDVAAAGALGTKALGASGGGCVLVIAGEGREHAVRTALGEHAQLLPLEIARRGVQVHATNDTD
jgi:D-glycero-alpha-D-manno-heptose-7-phosphate kinase